MKEKEGKLEHITKSIIIFTKLWSVHLFNLGCSHALYIFQAEILSV